MNILFIHEVDYQRKVVFDIHWLAESMSLLGHRVYALYYESMWGLNGWETPKWSVASRALPNAKVELICPNFIRIPVLSRAFAFVSHYFAIKKVIQEKRIDAIVLYSVPTNGLQAVHWAKRFNVPVVFRSIDVLNQLVPYSLLRPMTKILERRVYSNVDKILTITPKLSEYVVGLGAKLENVDVLPIPVDTELFRPSDDTKGLRQKWGLDNNDKIILFVGTLFNFCGLDGFIQQLSRIEWHIPNVQLLIVGGGEQYRQLQNLIFDLGLQRIVTMTGFQPYRELPKYINLAEVCINPFVVNDTTRNIFPGKTAQFLACGKPVVMRPLDGVKALISGEEQGIVYADDADEMATELVSLLKNDERRRSIGMNGLAYVKKHHDCWNVAKQLEATLEGLIKEKKRNA